MDTESKLKIWNKNYNDLILFDTVEFKSMPPKVEKMILLKGDIDVLLTINNSKTITLIRFDKEYLEVKAKVDESATDKLVSLLDLENGFGFLVGKSNGEISYYTYNSRLELKKKTSIKHMDYCLISRDSKNINNSNLCLKESKVSSDQLIDLNKDKKDSIIIQTELKAQKITCLEKGLIEKRVCLISGAQDGSICIVNLKNMQCCYYLFSSKEHAFPIKCIFHHIDHGESYIFYLTEKGQVIIKNLENKIIKCYQNDRDIIFIEKLNTKYFYYSEKSMNNIYICQLSNVFAQLKVIKQINLTFDVSQSKYLKDGDGIITFGFDSVEGEPVMGNAMEYFKFFIEDLDIEEVKDKEDESRSETSKDESRDLFDDVDNKFDDE